MRWLCILLSLALVSLAIGSDDPPPTADQEKAILENIGSFIEQYVSTLPNLLCIQTTEQYQSGKKGEHWRKGDTLTARLALVSGREKHTLELVNNTPVSQVKRRWRTPLSTEGEFGDMLAVVLAESSDAKISWNRWDTVSGKHVAVFDYAIDARHSSLKLSLSDVANAVLPYSGSLFADPVSGAVWRVTNNVLEIPPELRTLEMHTTLDYGEIPIGGKNFMLPVHATVLNKNQDGFLRNEIDFNGYRKFEAESTIKFDTEPESPAPPSQPR